VESGDTAETARRIQEKQLELCCCCPIAAKLYDLEILPPEFTTVQSNKPDCCSKNPK
jgi:hypothetical protein